MKRLSLWGIIFFCSHIQVTYTMYAWSKNAWGNARKYISALRWQYSGPKNNSRVLPGSLPTSNSTRFWQSYKKPLIATGLCTSAATFSQKDYLKATYFNVAPPLTQENIKKYPQFKDAFIQQAITTIPTIDNDVLSEIWDVYPDAIAQFIQPISENFDKINPRLIKKVLREYAPSAYFFVAPSIQHFNKIDPWIIYDIMLENKAAAENFIAPAALHFATTPAFILEHILQKNPELAAAAFTQPALQHWQSVMPSVLRSIVRGNPHAPLFLQQRLKALENNAHGGNNNELFYS